MKKSFTKIIAVLMAMTLLMLCGIPVFADFSTVQSGYGSQSGSNSVMIWSLAVTPYYSSSNGSLLGGYTGYVYCDVVVSGNESESTAMTTNSQFLNGYGESAEISFTQVSPTHIGFQIDERLFGYGSRSGYTPPAHWSLIVSPTQARSYGYLDNGYTGDIYCGIIVDYNWYDSDATDSNLLERSGDGSWAEIWIR